MAQRGRPRKVVLEEIPGIGIQEVQTPVVDTLNRAARPVRVPINGNRDRLAIKGAEAGWHYCWVNDKVNNEEGNIERYQDGGYDYVTHNVKVGDRSVNAASQVGGRISKAVGNGVTAYLMRCPEEVYLEEIRTVDALTNSQEETIFGTKRGDGLRGKIESSTGLHKRGDPIEI